jgi:hypothetical protein
MSPLVLGGDMGHEIVAGKLIRNISLLGLIASSLLVHRAIRGRSSYQCRIRSLQGKVVVEPIIK